MSSRPAPDRISLVIPCYNEAAGLPALFESVARVAETWGCAWEVILVDDGSTDQTWELLQAQHQRDPRWRALSLARNFGHQTAISAGLFHAVGQAVVIMDADLQDPPELIADFIGKWREGGDVVYGIRAKRKENAIKRAAYWLFYRLIQRLSPVRIPVDAGDFCLMDRRVVDILKQMPERNRFVRGMRAWIGFRQCGVVYDRPARSVGAVKYTFSKLAALALDGIFSSSALPLRFASYIGMWVSALALFGIVFTFFQRVFSSFFARFGLAPVPGFATIVISVLFLGGVQLLCIGILGEYLGRIYDEVKRRPAWIVRTALGVETQPPPN